jgi:ABC-type antimicrobial peptide transport system permease subunit
MKIIDYIYLANKNLSRRKGSVILNTILIAISVIILILVISFTNSLKDTIDRAIVNNISYRTIVITGVKEKQDELIKKIYDDENIIKVIKDSEYNSHGTISKIDNVESNYSISLIGSDVNTQPYVIKGRNIKEGETKVCIVPSKYFLDSVYVNYNKDNYINGEDLLGKKISIEYYAYDCSLGDYNAKKYKTFNDEYEVIGVYDSDENYMYGDDCFIAFSDIYEINKNVEDYNIPDPNTNYSSSNTLYAIVNNSLNVETSLEKIQQLGYRALVRSTANTQIVYIINVVTSIVLAVLIVIIVANITTSSIKSITERQYEVGMLKAMGYKNKNIKGILLCENLIISIRAYIIGFLISFIVMKLLQINLFSKYVELDQLNINLNIRICILALIGSVLVPVISNVLSGRKMFKRTPVSLNKER